MCFVISSLRSIILSMPSSIFKSYLYAFSLIVSFRFADNQMQILFYRLTKCQFQCKMHLKQFANSFHFNAVQWFLCLFAETWANKLRKNNATCFHTNTLCVCVRVYRSYFFSPVVSLSLAQCATKVKLTSNVKQREISFRFSDYRKWTMFLCVCVRMCVFIGLATERHCQFQDTHTKLQLSYEMHLVYMTESFLPFTGYEVSYYSCIQHKSTVKHKIMT